MNTRRMASRRLEERRVNEAVPPQVEQVFQGDSLARAMTTHFNRGIEPRVDVVESIMTSRLRDFVKMNPPIFLRSKVREDL